MTSRILNDIGKLAALFAEHCQDRETLDRLVAMLDDRQSWTRARSLFDHIRNKTLSAERASNEDLVAQYAFEEVCAKTLYNLTLQSAPYDPDVPYWITPNAFALARRLKLDPSLVLAIVAA